MQAKLSIGVIQFLLLTALCDRKINPATKLIYLFLSLALLLIPSLLQIGFSYKPEGIHIFITQFKDMFREMAGGVG